MTVNLKYDWFFSRERKTAGVRDDEVIEVGNGVEVKFKAEVLCCMRRRNCHKQKVNGERGEM